MTKFFKIYLALFTLTTIFSLEVESYAKEEMKICKQGLRKCQYLINNRSMYRQCMIEQCSSYYKDRTNRDIFEKRQMTPVGERSTRERKRRSGGFSRLTSNAEQLEKIKICEFGSRKCDVLRKTNQAFYWKCMKSECENPQNQSFPPNPNCEEGRNDKICRELSGDYRSCVYYVCGKNDNGEWEFCDKGKEMCTPALEEYWHCVYQQCLGSVDAYYDIPIEPNKRVMVEDMQGNTSVIRYDKFTPSLSGVAPQFRTPPKRGINPDEWSRGIPSQYILFNNPAKNLKCAMPNKKLICDTVDVRSCYCSDGSMPIYLKGPPRQLDTSEW
jgi:hypothetical protein